ncbi:MAG: hypothetical protein K2X31_04800 [Sphingopyxis sp.]|nr:hypothetical protein [Sphingopyxis sp.]
MDRVMDTLERVIAIAHDRTGIAISELSAASAIDHDLDLVGDDASDFCLALEHEFGDWIRSWPWQRFVDFNEGLSLLFPFMLVWQLVTWPFRGSFSYRSTLERLELGHVAAVIDRGEWFEP